MVLEAQGVDNTPKYLLQKSQNPNLRNTVAEFVIFDVVWGRYKLNDTVRSLSPNARIYILSSFFLNNFVNLQVYMNVCET